MVKTTRVTTRLSPELKSRLEALSKRTRRSQSDLVEEALEAYVAAVAWQVRHITLALEEAKRGAPGVPHERVVEWLKSWGTDHELPPPKVEKDR